MSAVRILKKTEHRTIDGERISDERTKNRRAEHRLKLLEDDKSVNPRNVPEYLRSLLMTAKRQGQHPLTFFETLFTCDTVTAQAALYNGNC